MFRPLKKAPQVSQNLFPPMTQPCITTQTLASSIYLPLQRPEGSGGRRSRSGRYHARPALASSPDTHTRTDVHGGDRNPAPPTPPYSRPCRCAVQARLNHSLMRGLTNRYCYSLWGAAAHTDRRLWRSGYQRRRSGYLCAYNGLE